jgi:hypothetical protein
MSSCNSCVRAFRVEGQRQIAGRRYWHVSLIEEVRSQKSEEKPSAAGRHLLAVSFQPSAISFQPRCATSRGTSPPTTLYILRAESLDDRTCKRYEGRALFFWLLTSDSCLPLRLTPDTWHLTPGTCPCPWQFGPRRATRLMVPARKKGAGSSACKWCKKTSDSLA